MYDPYQSSQREFNQYKSTIDYNPDISKIDTTNPHTALFLFTPKRLSQQYKRPMVYQLDLNTLDAIHDCVQKSFDNYGNHYQQSFMYEYPQSATAILPDAMGMHFNTDYLSNNWNFMLVVNNERMNTVSGITNIIHMANKQTRKIYVGFCNGEPISANGTINPNCVLSITHYSNISEQIQDSAIGHLRDYVVHSNVDIVQPQINLLVNEPLYKIDPSTLYESTEIASELNDNNNNYYHSRYNNNLSNIDVHYDTEDDYSVQSHDRPYVNHLSMNDNNDVTISISDTNAKYIDEKPLLVKAALNDPRNIIHGIVSSAVEGLATSTIMNDSDLYHSNYFTSAPNIKTNIESSLNRFCSVSNLISQIDPKAPMELGTLLKLYPGMEINKVTIPRTNEFSAYDQGEINCVTQMSSLIASSLPAILADIGLLSITFRYCSYQKNNIRGVFKLENIETFNTISDIKIVKKWELLQRILEQSLFESIRLVAGPFDLMCSCSNGDVSLILLNFLDVNEINNNIYETSNRLGGFNTPLLGTSSNFLNNSNVIANLNQALLSS